MDTETNEISISDYGKRYGYFMLMSLHSQIDSLFSYSSNETKTNDIIWFFKISLSLTIDIGFFSYV